jgi:hypothetical protein
VSWRCASTAWGAPRATGDASGSLGSTRAGVDAASWVGATSS